MLHFSMWFYNEITNSYLKIVKTPIEVRSLCMSSVYNTMSQQSWNQY